jgi:hypothetical protein
MNNQFYTQLCKFIKLGRFKDFFKLYNSIPKADFKTENFGMISRSIALKEHACSHALACYQAFLDESEINYGNLYFSLSVCTAFARFPYAYDARFAHEMRYLELKNEKIGTIHGILASEWHLEEIEQYELIKLGLNLVPNDYRFNKALEYIPQEIKDNPTTFLETAAKMIAQDKHSAFKELVKRGRFIEARLLFWQLTHDEIEQHIFELADEFQCFTAYDFTWDLMRHLGEKARWHTLLAKITPLIFREPDKDPVELLDGVKELVFFHTYRAAELEPGNIELQEKLLNLYEPENESFDVAEIKALAEQVLTKKPESEPAKLVLSLINTPENTVT